MLREIKTIHQLLTYSTGLFHSLAEIPLTLFPPVPFFRYSRKNVSITPGSPAEGGAGSATWHSFWALRVERRNSCFISCFF
jgi:hypothetical protein